MGSRNSCSRRRLWPAVSPITVSVPWVSLSLSLSLTLVKVVATIGVCRVGVCSVVGRSVWVGVCVCAVDQILRVSLGLWFSLSLTLPKAVSIAIGAWVVGSIGIWPVETTVAIGVPGVSLGLWFSLSLTLVKVAVSIAIGAWIVGYWTTIAILAI